MDPYSLHSFPSDFGKKINGGGKALWKNAVMNVQQRLAALKCIRRNHHLLSTRAGGSRAPVPLQSSCHLIVLALADALEEDELVLSTDVTHQWPRQRTHM